MHWNSVVVPATPEQVLGLERELERDAGVVPRGVGRLDGELDLAVRRERLGEHRAADLVGSEDSTGAEAGLAGRGQFDRGQFDVVGDQQVVGGRLRPGVVGAGQLEERRHRVDDVRIHRVGGGSGQRHGSGQRDRHERVPQGVQVFHGSSFF